MAERIVRQLESRSGRRGNWFEIRALMSEFEIERLSDGARRRMASALRDAGLTLNPPLDGANRRDTVVLSWGQGARLHEVAGVSQGFQPLAEVLTVRIAPPGQAVRDVSLEELKVSDHGGVRWFDVSDTAHVDSGELLECLNALCGAALTEEMVEDLLSPDPRPKIKRWTSTIHGVAAFRVSAEESDEGVSANSKSKAGVLVFEPVEFLVGVDWVITCWHDAEVFRGAERIREAPPNQPRELFREVGRSWSGKELSSAGDLAVLILLELVMTIAPAYRQLQIWEEEWELDFFRRRDRIDRDTLLEARASAAILRDWLGPLNPPGLRQDAERAWFPGVTGSAASGGYEVALRVDDRVDRALRSLQEFGQTLRSAYDLLQLREGEHERHRDDRFQHTIAVGGAAILIPTLVAGVMGVNTWVPGEAGPTSSHWAFLALLVVVLLSGVSAWVALRRLRDREKRRS